MTTKPKRTKIDGVTFARRSALPQGHHLRRLNYLEGWMQLPEAILPHKSTDADWLTHFDHHGRNGHYASEPDFPQALQEYREALRRVKTDPTQHYHPPAGFMTHARQHDRVTTWREGRNYPEIDDAWLWLAAMSMRITKRQPGVPLSEWNQLKTWFQANWQLWGTTRLVTDLLKQEEIVLSDLAAKVSRESGRTPRVNNLIGPLRQLWACCYSPNSLKE